MRCRLFNNTSSVGVLVAHIKDWTYVGTQTHATRKPTKHIETNECIYACFTYTLFQLPAWASSDFACHFMCRNCRKSKNYTAKVNLGRLVFKSEFAFCYINFMHVMFWH
uniref:Uncharacterized protein n=1 Tax=Rhipicephalus zambeziensis TaxID=60191 RepID=A0A224YLR1_9ACAR